MPFKTNETQTLAAISTCGDKSVSNNDEGCAQSCEINRMVIPPKRRTATKPTALDLVRGKGMADIFRRKRHVGVNGKENRHKIEFHVRAAEEGTGFDKRHAEVPAAGTQTAMCMS